METSFALSFQRLSCGFTLVSAHLTRHTFIYEANREIYIHQNGIIISVEMTIKKHKYKEKKYLSAFSEKVTFWGFQQIDHFWFSFQKTQKQKGKLFILPVIEKIVFSQGLNFVSKILA